MGPKSTGRGRKPHGKNPPRGCVRSGPESCDLADDAWSDLHSTKIMTVAWSWVKRGVKKEMGAGQKRIRRISPRVSEPERYNASSADR